MQNYQNLIKKLLNKNLFLGEESRQSILSSLDTMTIESQEVLLVFLTSANQEEENLLKNLTKIDPQWVDRLDAELFKEKTQARIKAESESKAAESINLESLMQNI
ncbi:MAG TPA: hypothetical protein PLQ36_00940 [Candidatus Gracilibacteria bacterium]|nr:hypothetical protein [Candidatus Gracilibacteria bacterium]